MNKMLIGVIAIAVALIGTGCESTTNGSADLDQPFVTPVAAIDGGTLRLSWNAIDGAASYEITAGDSVYTTTADSFDITVPATTIEVRAVKGSSKSDPAMVSCKVLESTVEFFADLDGTHANGFGFDDDGKVTACTLSQYPGQYMMDFYGDSAGGGIRLNRAVVTQSAFGNALKAAAASYDDATMADPLGTYSADLVVMVDSTYYLRLSADTTNTWGEGDNFAKVRVDSIVGAKISLTTAYQKVAGLRWLMK